MDLTPLFSLQKTLLVPSLTNKLLSVGQATEELNCCVLMYPTFYLFQDILTKKIIGRGTKRGGLYCMDDCSLEMANSIKHTTNKEHQIQIWHRHLGHPSFSYLKHLFPSLFSQIDDRVFEYETCIQAKSHRTSFPVLLNKMNITPFLLIHSNVWGPTPHSDGSGVKWFVIFIDDCTRMTWLYLMKYKNEVFQIFQAFHKMVQT